MAVPKRKWSKMRSNRARSNWRAMKAPTLVECPRCHSLMAAHKVCRTCGTYRGRDVLKLQDA